MPDTLPVLIVGAGPSGLTMALELHRYGIPFRIIDKKIIVLRFIITYIKWHRREIGPILQVIFSVSKINIVK